MKTRLVAALALILALASLSRAPLAAQDKEAPKQSLLRQYLAETDDTKKKDLRAKLLALGAAELRAAIAKLEYTKPNDLGAVEFTTKCPDGFERPYYMRVPAKYDVAKSYPLIISLHGGVSQAPAEAASYQIEQWEQMLGEKWGDEVIILAPAAIAADTTDDARWWRDKGQKNVLHMLREVKTRFNIDDNRVFLIGMSDGGTGSFEFANRRPDSFAGYFPLVGHPLIPAMDGARVFWENFKGAKIYAIAGGKDGLYPAAQVAKVVKEANENGASIDLKIYEEAGHDLSYAPKEIPVILEDKVAKWTRDFSQKEIDWSTDSAGSGRRAWLSITELAKLGDKNAKDLAATPRTGQARVLLGISIAPDAEPDSAVIVDQVTPDSVADKMGIQVGDKITKLDDTKTGNLNELREALSKKNLGDDVRVTIERGGKEQELKGKFPAPKAEKDAAVLARVKAAQKPLTAKDEKGSVHGTLFEVSVTNASKLTIYLTAEQVKLGKAVVTINGGEGIAFEKLEESAEVILAEFERGCDRKSPFVARIDIDVAKHLGAKVKPVQEPGDDDEGF